MSNRSKSPLSIVRVTSLSLIIGLVLVLAANASAGTGFADSLASFFGFAAETTTSAPEPAAPMFTGGVCDTAGPIEVEGSILGTTPTAYTTLTAAFAAINAGTHTGAIIIDVCGDTAEGTGTALLSASGTGSSSYTSITMSPVGGVARTISGGTTAGSPMIDFSGADNVTIDGLNTGGNSLTIANTVSPGSSGTSTIRFIGGATNNTITNCNIQGSKGTSVSTNGAVVTFSTDSVTASGNDNNTISNNNIGPAGANLPTTAIQCNGSTTTTAIGNSGLVINNNNIFDYFAAGLTSSGIAVNGGCNTFSITNNRFYQTGTRTWTAAAIHRAIDLNSSTATSGVQGMTVTGNIIGYASNTQTGTYTLTGVGAGAKFHGIFMNGITGGTTSNINANTVAAVSMTGVTGNGASTSSPFAAILVNNGLVNTNSNTIGSQSATGSLVFSTTTATASDVYGIYNFASDDWTANGNSIGGISVTNAGSSNIFLYAIRANTLTTKIFSATSNNVGGTVANSISLTSNGVTGSQVAGIQTSNAGSTWTANTVRNLTNNNGTATTTGASVVGLLSTTTSTNHTLSQNTIHTLNNSSTLGSVVLTGIQFTGSTANVVERNNIYNLTTASSSNGAEINGIRVSGGTTTYRNNMIALGANQATAIGVAASNSSTTGINGFNGALGTDVFVHNSVYIGGTATSGSGASYALNGTQTVNTRSFRDNIFQNARTNSGGTGTHYAVKINGTAANPTGLTINNNVYLANGASGAMFGFFNSANVASIAAWRTAVGQDAGSFEGNPQYNAPTNATPDLHLHPSLTTVAEGNGADVGVTLDYDGQTRSGLTPVDIGADAGNFTGIDLSAPIISYTALGGTVSTANRTLSVTISDATAVDQTVGGGPRMWFRKGTSGAYSQTSCSSTGGTPQSGTYNCTIDNSVLGGVVVDDIVQYYVAAQDTLGNVSTNPSGGSGATPPGSTAPGSPNSYTILLEITSYPYSQDFETNSGNYAAGFTLGSASDWQYGTFAKTQISAPHSGTKAWITKLTGSYTLSTTSTLTSPVFNFSTMVGRPTLSFWHNFKTELNWDAGILEYSTNGGSSWTKVDATLGTGGTFNTTDSTFWYNNSSTSGPITQPKFSSTSTGYTGHSSGWIQSTTLLPAGVVGQADVRLRWVFGSDSSTADEGWAIDDVSVTAPAPTATNTNTPSNTATFTPSETSTETATATSTATSTNTPTSTPTASSNLKITKTDNVDPVEELTPWKYTVRIENLGPDRTSGITMQDTIPIEILFLSLKSTMPIPVGEDLFWTPPGGTVSAWGASPIPPGFFNPGSDPFSGTVQLGGQPTGPGPYSPSGLCPGFPPLGAGPNGQHGMQGSPAGCGGPGLPATDTIVRRMAPSSLPMDGGSANIPIELVQLSLQSVMPITVTTGGGGSPEPWQVQVGLAPGPQPAGNMMLNRNANSNNGTMTINLPVNRRYTFVDVGTAGHPTVFIDRLEVFTGSGTFTQDTGSCSTPAPNTNGTISCSGYTIDSFFDIFFEIDVTSTANAGGTTWSNTATTSGTEFDPDLSNNSDTETTTITEPPTPTNTATDTPTATNTSTPTDTPTSTATSTETATATQSSTNTATPTPTAGSIAGTVTYGNSIGSPAPPRYVPNVLISGAGSPAVSDTTGAPGTYFLTGFGAGSYTVTPSKSGQTGSITSLDAARIAQYLTGAISFSSAQLTVADVSGAGGISSFDAALIARYAAALGAPTGSSGTWIFSPVNRTYPVVLDTDFTGEDYSALLMGEVSGNYDPAGLRPAFAAGPERSAAVGAPKLVTPADNEVIIPVSVAGAADKGIISYEFDLRYDPAVIQPQADPVEIAGTVSSGLMAVANAEGRGLLRVVVYGPTPIDANGVLLNLKFTAVGAPGSVTPLTFERFMFNEGDPRVMVSDGQLELSAAASNQAEIGGRLLSSIGQGIPNARVTLTDTAGQSRSVRSNGFGVYRFGSLKVGLTYTISVEAGNYLFTPMTVSVTGQSVAADMIAEQ